MASGETNTYDFPYPILTDPVNVHEDIQSLAEAVDAVLPTLFAPLHTLEVRNVSGTSIVKGDPVYITGYTTKPTVARSVAENLETFPVVGLAQSNFGSGSDGVIVLSGIFSSINTNAYSAGDVLYVATGGGLTSTQPAAGSGAVAVVARNHSTLGVLIVGQPKGNGTWGSMKAGLA
jgi:hypothetical protein